MCGHGEKKLIYMIITSACLYVLASVLRRKARAATAFFICGWLLNAACIASITLSCGRLPLENTKQVLVFCGACFLPVWLAFEKSGIREAGAAKFSLPAALSLLASVFVRDGSMAVSGNPFLESAWFVPHVVSYAVSYSLMGVAFISGVAAFFGEKAGSREGSERCDEIAFRLVKISFPLMSFGLLSGAAWADAAWSSYWSWDAKETWSLITWMLYLLYLHLRKGPVPAVFSRTAHFLAFSSLIITFLAVNLLPGMKSALHSNF